MCRWIDNNLCCKREYRGWSRIAIKLEKSKLEKLNNYHEGFGTHIIFYGIKYDYFF